MAMTSISIDDDVLKKARDSQINISAAAQTGIKAKMNIKDVQIDSSDKTCVDCKIKPGDSWLYPDEVWLCDSCLYARGRKIAQ